MAKEHFEDAMAFRKNWENGRYDELVAIKALGYKPRGTLGDQLVDVRFWSCGMDGSLVAEEDIPVHEAWHTRIKK